MTRAGGVPSVPSGRPAVCPSLDCPKLGVKPGCSSWASRSASRWSPSATRSGRAARRASAQAASWALDQSLTATTVGFAIPSNTSLAVVNQIRSGQANSEVILGQVGYIGVQVTDLNANIVARLGLSSTSGALVTGVVAGSPAASAGIGRYSVITAAAGMTVDTAATLGTALHSHKPGDHVDVTGIDSSGGSHTASITLGTGPAI